MIIKGEVLKGIHTIMKKFGRRLLVITILGSLAVASLTGCGKEKEKVDVVYSAETASATDALMVGDETVSMAEVLAYGIQYVYVQNVTSDTMDVDVTKAAIIDSLRQSKLIYNVAKKNDFELPDGYKESVEKAISNTMKMFDDDFYKKYGITEDVLRQVYTEQCYVEAYSSYIKNDMKEKITADLTDACKNFEFVKLYYVRFPLIKLDDSGEAITDDDGNYVKISDEEKADVIYNTQAAIKEIQAGNDIKATLEKYGVADYSQETNGYIGAYSEEINEILGKLKKGECSDILEDEVSFVFLVMLDDKNEDAREAYIEAQAQDVLDNQFTEVQKKWLQTIAIDDEKDFCGTEWEDFDINEFVDSVNKYKK